MENKFPQKSFEKFGHTSGGCSFFQKFCKFYSVLAILIRASWTPHERLAATRIRK